MLYLRLEYQFYGLLSVLPVNLFTEYVIENSEWRQTKVLNETLKNGGGWSLDQERIEKLTQTI